MTPTDPLRALAARMRQHPTERRHWTCSAVLGYWAHLRLSGAVAGARAEGAIVQQTTRRRPWLRRSVILAMYGEGGQMAALVDMLAATALPQRHLGRHRKGGATGTAQGVESAAEALDSISGPSVVPDPGSVPQPEPQQEPQPQPGPEPGDGPEGCDEPSRSGPATEPGRRWRQPYPEL